MDPRLRAFAYPFLLAWEWFKDWLSATVHLSHNSLHVVCGLAIFLIVGRLLRKRLSSFWPLAPVALLEAANETMDYSRYAADHWPWRWGPTILEVFLTLLPPLTVILLARVVEWRRAAAGRTAAPPAR